MWRAGPVRMRRGTQGHVAEPTRPTRRAGGAGGADTWQEATGSTWVHADARVGCHVARGWPLEGPRVSGPWLGVWGGNANALSRPNFYTHEFGFSIRVGLCSCKFFLCRRRGCTVGVRFDRDDGDHMDPSPSDHQSGTCVNKTLK